MWAHRLPHAARSGTTEPERSRRHARAYCEPCPEGPLGAARRSRSAHAVSRKPLSSLDAAERAQLLRLAFTTGIPALVMLSALDLGLFARGQIGPGLLFILLFLNLPMTGLLVYGMWRLIGGASQGLVQVLYGAGNLTPERQHSSQESLVARGFYREAAEAYRAHILQYPDDHTARIKLALLEYQHLNDPAAAERLYLAVRTGQPTPKLEILATNMLIELYRSTGQRGRLMAELARFAKKYAGTRAGEDAGRALQEMKADND